MKIFTVILFLGLLVSEIIAQGYTLDDCIRTALEGKKTVLSAELGVISATKGLTGSYSGLLPSLRATTSAGQTQFPEQESFTINYETLTLDTAKTSHFNNLSAGVSLNQTIYDGGRSFNQFKQARTNLDIARLNQRLTKIQVIQNVIKSYYLSLIHI